MKSNHFENKLKHYQYSLYAITDRSWTQNETLESQVEKAIKGGVTIIQIREKGIDTTEFITRAKRIQAITNAYNIPLIINDDVYVAKEIQASGVHIGQNDMSLYDARQILGEQAIIGVSVHTVEEALKAEAEGATYIGVGALFQTDTKQDACVLAQNTVQNITRAVTIPVVGIGGITLNNLDQLKETGLSGISVISAIFAQADIQLASQKLLEKTQTVLALKTKTLPKILTIAGSDCSGGAGIQADLKTITAHGMYGMSVITALTAQNTKGVFGIQETPAAFVTKQLEVIFSDIKPDAIKIGMVSSAEIITAISEFLIQHKEHLKQVVIDPVMVSTSGSKLLSDEALLKLKTQLLPLASLITPNLPEAEILSGMAITNRNEMMAAAQQISRFYQGHILIKGGHLASCSDDLLFYENHYQWFEQKKIFTENTHGTGCTLSSALACNLAAGKDIFSSVKHAKAYVTGAIYSGLELGGGNGPLNHIW